MFSASETPPEVRADATEAESVPLKERLAASAQDLTAPIYSVLVSGDDSQHEAYSRHSGNYIVESNGACDICDDMQHSLAQVVGIKAVGLNV